MGNNEHKLSDSELANEYATLIKAGNSGDLEASDQAMMLESEIQRRWLYEQGIDLSTQK